MEAGEGEGGGTKRSRMSGSNKWDVAICKVIVSLLRGLAAAGWHRGGGAF